MKVQHVTLKVQRVTLKQKCTNVTSKKFIMRQSCHHIETSNLICSPYHLTGSYMTTTLAFIGLTIFLFCSEIMDMHPF